MLLNCKMFCLSKWVLCFFEIFKMRIKSTDRHLYLPLKQLVIILSIHYIAYNRKTRYSHFLRALASWSPRLITATRLRHANLRKHMQPKDAHAISASETRCLRAVRSGATGLQRQAPASATAFSASISALLCVGSVKLHTHTRFARVHFETAAKRQTWCSYSTARSTHIRTHTEANRKSI